MNLYWFLILAFTVVVSCASNESIKDKVDQRLLSILEVSTTSNAFITFSEGTSSILKSFSKSQFKTRSSKLSALRSKLIQHAVQSQTNVINFLEKSSINYKSLWITNQLFLKNVNIEILSSLTEFPEVKWINVEEFMHIDKPINHQSQGGILKERENKVFATEWNIQKIQAEEAQNLLKNLTSTPASVRVAVISNGVRGTHESIRDNFQGEYGWFDAIDNSKLPHEDSLGGYGTHNLGTICGKGGIGVYPDAKWIACKACDSLGSCSQSAILECSQYIICPTRPDGSDPNCEESPSVVHGNWGGGKGQTWLDDTIMTWLESGINAVFPIGGSGPACKTASSPGDTTKPIFSVGATTKEDACFERSSLGPSVYGALKPEVTAPGEMVRSASAESDESYAVYTGTSIASPHVAGLIALLKAYNSSLSWGDLNAILTSKGVETEPLQPDLRDCGDVFPNQTFPNHVYGWGRINVFSSLKAASSS